jgi:hypothetical protein
MTGGRWVWSCRFVEGVSGSSHGRKATIGPQRRRHAAHTGIYQIRRGSKRAAAYVLHTILTANDDRGRTMHVVAARTDRKFLPTIVAALLDQNDQRRAGRTQAWRRHSAQIRARDAAYQRTLGESGAHGIVPTRPNTARSNTEGYR